MQVTFRPWESKDISQIALLEQACFTLEAWTKEQLEDTFNRDGFCGYLAEVSGEVIGYVCATYVFETADLLIIAVKESARGQGLGGVLIEKLFNGLREQGVEKVFLEVRASNAPAKALYQSKGFALTRVRKKYYADGEDAVEMFVTL